jgi:SAM-dependent methyltransferase
MDPDFGRQLLGKQPDSVWCLDHIRVDGDTLILDGWALAPSAAKPAIAVNGVRFSTRFGDPRPDLELVMAFDKRASTAGFHAECAGLAAIFAGRDFLEVQFCDEATMRPFNKAHSFYWPLDPPKHALPDPERRKRVHGGVSMEGFVMSGFSTYKKLSNLLVEYSRSWETSARILDWGCGCGRLFRYLPQGVLPRLVGADIDSDNIEWCRANFPGAEFHVAPLLPPTLLPENEFDVIVGISVLTHLQEPIEHAWLQELSRIARPGALLLLTIHGPAAGARANLSEEQYREWIDRGFVNLGLSEDLGSAVPDSTYYVVTLHTHEYVRREWGRYFEIVEIRESLVANHQDMVVMRKR